MEYLFGVVWELLYVDCNECFAMPSATVIVRSGGLLCLKPHPMVL